MRTFITLINIPFCSFYYKTIKSSFAAVKDETGIGDIWNGILFDRPAFFVLFLHSFGGDMAWLCKIDCIMEN